MKIVMVEQMRQLERRADAVGVSYAQMMEAGRRAFACIVRRRRINAAQDAALVFSTPKSEERSGVKNLGVTPTRFFAPR